MVLVKKNNIDNIRQASYLVKSGAIFNCFLVKKNFFDNISHAVIHKGRGFFDKNISFG